MIMISIPLKIVKIWSKKLKLDNKSVIQAASYAQRAVDYIFEHQDMNAESVKVQVSDVTP